MKTYKLAGQERTDLGKKVTKELRAQGAVPAVVYGGEKDGKAVHFTVQSSEIRNLIYSPDVFMVELTVGKEKIKSVLHQIQFHPVTDAVLHLDFLHIFDDRPMVVELPIEFKGLAAGVRAGGRLTTDMRKLKVKGLLKDMPERLTVDVTALELGHTIQVGELNFEGLELLNAENAVVCRVRLTRAARGAAAKEGAK